MHRMDALEQLSEAVMPVSPWIAPVTDSPGTMPTMVRSLVLEIQAYFLPSINCDMQDGGRGHRNSAGDSRGANLRAELSAHLQSDSIFQQGDRHR